jgi:cleavage stimulation factor subunit 3
MSSPAGWERERDRELQHVKKDREDDKASTLPAVISWFVGQLPSPVSFDGPSRFFLPQTLEE